MSVSRWRWTESCDSKPCCGDCDECSEETEDEEQTMIKGAIHYESPIKVSFEDRLKESLLNEEEKAIMGEVHMFVNVDKDGLVKALQYDRGQYEKGYKDGYNQGVEDGANRMFERLKEFLSEREEDND